MDHLPDLAGRLCTRWRVTASASHVVLTAHRLVHTVRQLDAPSFPCLSIVQIGNHFCNDIANARLDMRVCLNKKIVRRDVAIAATRTDACAIADMR